MKGLGGHFLLGVTWLVVIQSCCRVGGGKHLLLSHIAVMLNKQTNNNHNKK